MTKNTQVEKSSIADSYDVCIIGSGPAGIITALEYANLNPLKSVLLVEYGDNKKSRIKQPWMKRSRLQIPLIIICHMNAPTKVLAVHRKHGEVDALCMTRLTSYLNAQ